ncbi:MAG: LysR family transcriptional regulator [Verrucomicrobiales bacterium]|nr:LysR family transcriptional regulator [Verrucomicrobiales bacterium]
MLDHMELRQLRYFVAVAEVGNISRAAKRVFLTQSALSRQIKSLEEEIGLCLLERQAHSIRLTAVGRTLLSEATELLKHADGLLERVRASGEGTRLKVGYAPSLAAGFLSAAVANFSQVHPGTRVELFDLSSGEMLAGLEAGTVDVAITVAPSSAIRGLKWTPLVTSPWHLAVHRDRPLSRRASISPAEGADEPLLIYCRKDYPEYWDAVMGWFRTHRARPRVVGEYDGVDSLMAAVASGLGVALVASGKGRFVPDQVRLRTLKQAPDPVCIAAGCRADRDGEKPLAVLIEELKSAARRHGESVWPGRATESTAASPA